MAEFNLPIEVKKRYDKKIEKCGGVDPYDEGLVWSDRTTDLPDVGYCDIVHYLVYSRSAYTAQMMKNHKSMEAVQFYKSGKVVVVRSRRGSDDNVIVIGKVKHSMKLNEPSLKPWFLASKSGTIICAHSNCVAGLGESCSHVGAILFAVEDMVRCNDYPTCTDALAKWIAPNKVGVMVPLNKINFKLAIETESTGQMKEPEISPFSFDDIQNILSKMDGVGSSCSLSAVSPAYHEKYTIKEIDLEEREKLISMFFAQLYNPILEDLSIETLRQLDIPLHLTSHDVEYINKLTVGQNQNIYWPKFRTGRVTASTFKSVVVTNILKPSLSLVRRICYPGTDVQTAATKYGCKHEVTALEYFKDHVSNQHKSFKIWKTGLLTHVDYPYFGASPDAMICCDCCGLAVIEIKCPFCLKDGDDEAVFRLKNPYIKRDNGEVVIIKTHQYYYQIQMQMAMSGAKLGYFIFWSTNKKYVIKVNFDEQFWKVNSHKAIAFFKNVLMPELLAKYYTKNN